MVGSKTAVEVHKYWCAVLGLNQSRLAKRRGRFRLICYLRTFVVAGELADFAPVGQSAFRQGWQLCVKNALSLGWIVTT